MNFVSALLCAECGTGFSPIYGNFNCKRCGGELRVDYDYEKLRNRLLKEDLTKRAPGVWKYLELLPVVAGNNIISLGEGGTPLRKANRLGRILGLKKLFIKDETRNPTGSFKDRPISVGSSKIKELRGKTVVCASTGNVAASVAAYSSVGELEAYVFVPETVPKNKIVQALVYGAKIIPVVGSTSNDAMELAILAAKFFGWHHLSTVSRLNPYTIEGNKTIAYEICEQFQWNVPDWVVVPVGGGGNLGGIWNGFKDYQRIGFVTRVPRLAAIQAKGCMPFVDAVKRGLSLSEIVSWPNPSTIASGLADSYPLDGLQALAAMRESQGVAEAVTDAEILDAVRLLAKQEAIFAEPSGAASIAGVRKLVQTGSISGSESVVAIVTGAGLKQPENIIEEYKLPKPIVRTLEGLRNVFKEPFITYGNRTISASSD